jgi:hypothetical protein
VTDNQLSLQRFIQQTLDEICGAVENARFNRPYIAPANMPHAGDPTKSTLVDFDIAVSVTESDEQSENKQGGFKISVLMNSLKTGIDLDKKESSGSTNSTVTKIKFSVPVYFQLDEQKAQALKSRSGYAAPSRPLIVTTTG